MRWVNQATAQGCIGTRLFIFAALALSLPLARPGLVHAGEEHAGEEKEQDELLVYIGTYTRGEDPGIYRFTMNRETGELTPVGSTSGIPNPSFLAIHPSGNYLYAVSEINDFQGKRTGAVAALAIDRSQRGELAPLNRQPSAGDGPCHIVVDQTGRFVLVANYGGGSVAALPIQEDGSLGPPSSSVQHEGASVTSRQTAPHAHSINLAPSNRYAMAADLGLDKVLIYAFDAGAGKLSPNDPPAVDVTPGSGPRHFAFPPAGQFAYVINELSSTITAFRFLPDSGTLDPIQTISTLPANFSESSFTAEVQVHPSGDYVYGSNRGHDSLSVFRVEKQSGRLTLAGIVSSGGKTPRNFGIDPSGRFLLSANQQTGNVVVMRIDPATGIPEPTGHEVQVPRPVCVKFLE
jgi:6-phosphogluconolactonase